MFRLALLLCLIGLIYSQADQASEAIVGGHYVKKGDFKYQVALQTQGFNYCGGCIIADQYILTTAHCIMDDKGVIRIQPVKIIAGIENLKDMKHAIIGDVETAYIHKKFNIQSYQNDIAILKLKKGLDLSSNSKSIEKVNLASGSTDFSDVTAVVSGFGVQQVKFKKNKFGKLEEIGGTTDEKLKYAEVSIISHDKCVEMNKPQTILKSNICGQVLQHSKDHYEGVCSGDSGGPLVYKGEIIGILSISPIACNETSKTAIYTRVSSYLDLINNVISGKPGTDVVSVKLEK